MPGYYINRYDAQDFATVDLETEPPKKVEGRYWQIEYWVKEDAKKFGPVQIARNHTDPIVKRGGRKIVEDVDTSGGTTVAVLPAGGKNIWVQVQAGNSGDYYTLTVVEEAGMEQKVEFSAMEVSRMSVMRMPAQSIPERLQLARLPPTETNAIRHGSGSGLRQRCLVPFCTTQSPWRRCTFSPSSSSSVISPRTTMP